MTTPTRPGSTPTPDASASTATAVRATPGARMLYLIRRRAATTRDELVVHWFANHMPQVIARQQQQAAAGRNHAWRYIATLFDAPTGTVTQSDAAYDGVASLWYGAALPRWNGRGSAPTDTFQQKAEPYRSWATVEHVIVDGSARLPVQPLTLNAPAFPCTRSGFVKLIFLVAAKPGTQFPAFFAHWLQVHAANVKGVLADTGGFHYTISLSSEPEREAFAGMVELYFADATGPTRFHAALRADGMEQWVDVNATQAYTATTEMIGIP